MATYIQIGSTVTVGSGGAASIDFTSIPSTYTDLLVKICARTTNAAVNDNVSIRPNGATTSRTMRRIYGSGATATSDSLTDITVGNIAGSSATANTFGNAEFYLPNYASTTTFKTFSNDGVNESNIASVVYMSLVAGLWSSNSAITSLNLYSEAGANFVQYSTATLYGILKN
jgi:hypothetical protein